MADDPLDLTDLTVLISGGVGAIGRVVVGELASHGADVLVNDVVTPEEAAETLPGNERISYLPADLTEEPAVERLLDTCIDRHGRPPHVVCVHAGMAAAHPVHEYPIEVFDQVMRVNVRAAFLLARAAAARWIEFGDAGHLIFTTSWVQDVPWPGIAPYSASKAALRSLTRSFARELAPHGIRANAIAPGIVAAGMAKRQWDTEPDYRARASKAIPLGYLQPPETVADTFVFLVSRLARYMTGSVLVVDGGCSLYPMD